MAGNENSGRRPVVKPKMNMSDVTRIVGGVTRGTRQQVKRVSIDADGKMELIMQTDVHLKMSPGLGPLDDKLGLPTRSQLDLELDALADANQGHPGAPGDGEPGL